MFKESFKNKFKIENALKVCIFLIGLVLILGLTIGIVQVRNAKREQSDIRSIIQALSDDGITDKFKNQSADFIRKYPSTKNVLVTDNEFNVKYSVNKEIIGDLNKFELKRDTRNANISRLTGSDVSFITNPMSFKAKIPFRGNKTIFIRMEKPNPNTPFDVRGMNRNAFKELEMMRPNMPKETLFVKNFDIPEKGLIAYFLSTGFRENNFHQMQFILSAVLRFVGLGLWILLAFWVYKDSKYKGFSPVFWGIITLLTGPLGLLPYLFIRSYYDYCSQCGKRVAKEHSYCKHCGLKLKNECSNCKGSIDFNTSYCPICGMRQEENEEI